MVSLVAGVILDIVSRVRGIVPVVLRTVLLTSSEMTASCYPTAFSTTDGMNIVWRKWVLITLIGHALKILFSLR